MIDSFPWYYTVPAGDRLYQGEIVFDCPVARWQTGSTDAADLQAWAEYVELDAVIMSQDCDLENRKLESVILCPAITIAEARLPWEDFMRSKNQSPTDNAWISHLRKIGQGTEVGLALLNDFPETHPGGKRLVDFKDVSTVPLDFLEARVKGRADRLMLCPPYREHLSQSFARFFMRVGLPTPLSSLP